MRVLSSTLRRNIGNRALEDLQECLLYAFTADISRDRGVLRFLRDLIDLIDIDDTSLGRLDIIVCSLKKFQKDILNILTDVTCFRKCGRIRDRKRDIQRTRQCLGKKCLTTPGRSDQKDITLCKFDIVCRIKLREYTLIVVIYRDRKCLLRLLLSDDILIERSLQLGRCRKMIFRTCAGAFCGFDSDFVFRKDRLTDHHTLITDIDTRRARQHTGDFIFPFTTE